ncbi:hypothetical protein AAMO2058_001423900, partial [Amorphochlora amoebiformis]
MDSMGSFASKKHGASKTKKLANAILLGDGSSGKTNIFFQIQMMKGNGIEKKDLKSIKAQIHTSILECLLELVVSADTKALLGKVDFKINTLNRPTADGLKTRKTEISPEIAVDLNKLWNDPAIQLIFQDHEGRIKESYLDLPYFMSKITSISKPEYLPSKSDIHRTILRAHGARSVVGKLPSGRREFRLHQISGQRSERKKWISAFAFIDVVVFAVSLTAYDQEVDKETNAFSEILLDWEQTVKTKAFKNASFVLIFNKVDLFQKKVKRIPITTCPALADYKGDPNDWEDTLFHIGQKFGSYSRRVTHLPMASTDTGEDLLEKIEKLSDDRGEGTSVMEIGRFWSGDEIQKPGGWDDAVGETYGYGDDMKPEAKKVPMDEGSDPKPAIVKDLVLIPDSKKKAEEKHRKFAAAVKLPSNLQSALDKVIAKTRDHEDLKDTGIPDGSDPTYDYNNVSWKNRLNESLESSDDDKIPTGRVKGIDRDKVHRASSRSSSSIGYDALGKKDFDARNLRASNISKLDDYEILSGADFSKSLSADKVRFSASGPGTVGYSQSFCVNIWGYVRQKHIEILEDMKKESHSEKATSERFYDIRRGTSITCTLKLEEDYLEHEGSRSQRVRWDGAQCRVSFPVRSKKKEKANKSETESEKIANISARCQAHIMFGLVVVKIEFSIDITEDAPSYIERLSSTQTQIPIKPIDIPPSSIKRCQRIGEGQFGEVYMGEMEDEKVVIKYLKDFTGNKAQMSQAQAEFEAEMALCQLLGYHPNVATFRGALREGSSMGIVLDYYENDCVERYLDKKSKEKNPLGLLDKLRIARDSCNGLLHVHQSGVLHRDFAPRNCLLDKEIKSHVSDFGLAVLKQTHALDYLEVKKKFMPVKSLAPESISSGIFNEKSDAWMAGVFVWELLTEKKPYEEMLVKEAISHVRQGGHVAIPSDLPEGVQTLLGDCFHFKPTKRISLDELVQ